MGQKDRRARAYELRDSGVSVADIAREVGAHVGSVHRWLRARKAGTESGPSEPSAEGAPDLLIEYANDNAATIYARHAGRVSDMIEAAGIDADVWQIDRMVVNSWDVTVKLQTQQEARIETRSNWQVKLFLSRRVPREVEDSVGRIASRIAAHAPKYPKIVRPSRVRPKLLEVCPMDAHFGKLVREHERSGGHYDTEEARGVFTRAIEDLCAKVNPAEVERVLLVFGNDFMHVNSHRMETGHGTRIEGDPFFSEVWDVGADATIRAIEMLAGLAPVHVLFVPGNHGPDASRAVARFAEAWFRNAEQVTFDIGQDVTRKYYRHGTVLLGFTHGDEEKHSSLPLIMATEAPDLWGQTTVREIHTGHFHKAKQVQHLSTDAHNGVAVRVLPALCRTDPWHRRKGFTGNACAMEAFLWDGTYGLDTHFTIPVR